MLGCTHGGWAVYLVVTAQTKVENVTKWCTLDIVTVHQTACVSMYHDKVSTS